MSNTNAEAKPRLSYRVGEFCRLVGICQSTFYNHVKSGRIRPIKLGKRTLVPASEVERILRGEAA
jgi:excisionase family DNA binding protein